MKRIWMVCLLLCLWFPAMPAFTEVALPIIGVCIYNGEDTFMTSLLEVIRAEAADVATLKVYDAQNDQNRQNDQVEELLKAGLDALIVNPVDRTTAIYHLQMAMHYQVPIVFINREPLQEDLALYDNAYYVGIDPKEQGFLAGQLAAEHFRSHPEADKNRDGTLQFVIIKGEPGHQDAELRTLYTMKALQEENIRVEKLQEVAAYWERSLGQERMAAMLNVHSDRIECVISNNDDMALGAIDALKAAGYLTGGKYIPVIGCDATAPAMEALTQGSLYATVFNDATGQGRASVELAVLLARGEAVTEENFHYEMHDKVVYIKSTTYITDKVK